MNLILDLPEGEKLKLTQLQTVANQAGDWRQLPKEALEDIINCLKEYREMKREGIRTQKSSRAQDFRNTVRNIENEVCLFHTFF